MSVLRFGQGWGLLFLCVLTASGCSMVDRREFDGKLVNGDGARYHMKLTKALVAPTWYEEGVYDEHQRGFINLVQQMRMRGYPVTTAQLVSSTQVLTYSYGAVTQRPLLQELWVTSATHGKADRNLVITFNADILIRGAAKPFDLLTLKRKDNQPIDLTAYLDNSKVCAAKDATLTCDVTEPSPKDLPAISELIVAHNPHAVVPANFGYYQGSLAATIVSR